MLDALTYAGSRASLAGVEDRVRLVVGDIVDAALVDRLVGGQRRRRPLRRRVAQRQLPRTTRGRSCRPTSSGRSPSSRRPADTATRYHHISTDEVYGDLELDDPARFIRGHAVQPVEPILLDQGGRATCSSAPGCAPSGCARRSPTARTTTAPASTSRSSSRVRSRTSSTGCAPSSTATASTSATGSTWTTTTRPCGRSSSKGAIGETYLIGADGEVDNLDRRPGSSSS